jgi:hypothetical protein
MPSHPLGISGIRHDVVIIRELFMADGTDSVLFHDFPLLEFAHFSRRSELPVSSWVWGPRLAERPACRMRARWGRIFIKCSWQEGIACFAGDFETSNANWADKKGKKQPIVMSHISCNMLLYWVRYYPL